MMKLAATAILAGLLGWMPALSAAANLAGAKMVFPTNEYNFGRVVSGELVKHIFVVSNAGDQILVITRVDPGCHCTTVGEWAREIAPGRVGGIPIQFNSRGFRGEVRKPVTVTANDKYAPAQVVTLKGTVVQAFAVSPQIVFLSILPDATTNSTVVVHITNQLDEAVMISQPVSANGLFKAELKTIKPGSEFAVTISAIPPFAPGRNSGTISLKTSVTNMPLIKIQTYALVQPSILVAPLDMTLPPKIEGWTTNTVTITANGKKTLTLSDPVASDKRIMVELKENIPGRVFRLSAAFPPGFQVSANQPAQVSVKSNHPERPLIVVPVMQWARRP